MAMIHTMLYELMAEKYNAVEGGQVTGAEYLRHSPAGQRYGGEPQKSNGAAKQQGRDIREWDKEKQADDHSTAEIDKAQQVFF